MNTYSRSKLGIITTFMLVIALVYMPLTMAKEGNIAKDKSDLNSDQSVDTADLVIFSANYLSSFWESVDWCQFYEDTVAGNDFDGRRTKYFKRHFTLLLAFINSALDCGNSPYLLELENEPKSLVRITQSPNLNGDFYITDPRAGSLFIYDAELVLKGEIKNLSKPLGVAIDSLGYILVGNDGRDNIEVYDPADGAGLVTFGEDKVQMPTAITIGPDNEIYVTDSRSNVVWVFDANYEFVRSIGKPGIGQDTLTFPTDCEVVSFQSGDQWIYEVFVADQGNKRVQVFDLLGNWLRSITFEGTEGQNCNWFTGVCEVPGMPPFTRLQALQVDALGRLHVLDNFAAAVVILDPTDGTFLNAYGEYGLDPGFLRVPLDLLVSEPDKAIITPGAGDRIEVLAIPQ